MRAQNLDASTGSQPDGLTVGTRESGGWGHVVFITISPEADPTVLWGCLLPDPAPKGTSRSYKQKGGRAARIRPGEHLWSQDLTGDMPGHS